MGIIFLSILAVSIFPPIIDQYTIDAQTPVSIILSPHFDDAVLSLGGTIAQSTSKIVVATFFAGQPEQDLYTHWDTMSGFAGSNQAVSLRVRENARAIDTLNHSVAIKNFNYLDYQYRSRSPLAEHMIMEHIASDIKMLVSLYGNRPITIYGPAYFGKKITHPDHKIVHEAFIQISNELKEKNISFMEFEDFPYVNRFMNENKTIKLIDYLTTNDQTTLRQIILPIDSTNFSKKIAALTQYSSQMRAMSFGLNKTILDLASSFAQKRCENGAPSAYACEVVYKIE